MKNFFKYFGLAIIICLSFILSEKTVTVMNDMDSLMEEIKEKEGNYYIESIDANISGDYIIPGIYGKKVNIKKSYSEMKKIGKFNDKYLVYDYIKPNISIEDNKDKIINRGNKNKKMISLIFIVKDEYITNIINILESKNIRATFFVDSDWVKKNNTLCSELIKKGHTIGNMTKDSDFSFVWENNMIKTLGQNINYCYYDNCSSGKDYIIKPSIKSNNLTDIKKNINSGDIIELCINDKINNELPLIIDYIKSRGFSMENIDKHIIEKN